MKNLSEKNKLYLVIGAPFLALLVVLTYVAIAESPVLIVPVLLLVIAALVSGGLMMTGLSTQGSSGSSNQGTVDALNRVQAVIEFELDGTIKHANDNFLAAMGYTLDEIKGKHHSMFVEPAYRNSPEYRQFWSDLNAGKFMVDEFKRIRKDGSEVWIQGSYNPIFDSTGRPVSVIKFATDVTEQKLQRADFEGQLAAIDKAQAVISFSMDGTILNANENFLNALGYSLDEVKGRHHRIFVQKDLVESAEYRNFWEALNRGEYQAAEYLRIGKGGKEVWIQATYNPILDMNGKPFKVVKFATDVTERKLQEVENRKIANYSSALKGSQANIMMADNDFNIVYLNDEFLELMRYRESALRTALPSFSVDKLMGSCIDVFHKNPSHQRQMLSALREPYRTSIEIANLHFGLIFQPWYDLDGNRIGTIMQWIDRTAEVMIEREIAEVVNAANDGDFTKQIAMEGKEGFFANLSKGLNQVMGTVEVAINDIVRVLGAMAKGDLTERVTRDYEGALGQLKNDVNATADKLTDVIANIRQSSSAITSAANEIAQGNTDLSQRTEEQASALEETASSMEEMTSTVRQSAENAVEANRLASDAQQKAKHGGSVVNDAVVSMEEINKASKRISDIIGVIDEIAFQTNLLALNAAVEAARAGEQGRGFAVVAGEVRNLAQRSAAAAKEIKDLIRDSVAKVEDGTRLVNASGETLEQIVEAVERVTVIMRDLADAAQEQTSGIEQVNTAVSEMDEMTQQNAALVEEASAAGESLAEQAGSMSQMMDFFTVSSQMGGRSGTSDSDTLVYMPQRERKVHREAAPAKAARYKPAADEDEWEDF